MSDWPNRSVWIYDTKLSVLSGESVIKTSTKLTDLTNRNGLVKVSDSHWLKNTVWTLDIQARSFPVRKFPILCRMRYHSIIRTVLDTRTDTLRVSNSDCFGHFDRHFQFASGTIRSLTDSIRFGQWDRFRQLDRLSQPGPKGPIRKPCLTRSEYVSGTVLIVWTDRMRFDLSNTFCYFHQNAPIRPHRHFLVPRPMLSNLGIWKVSIIMMYMVYFSKRSDSDPLPDT